MLLTADLSAAALDQLEGMGFQTMPFASVPTDQTNGAGICAPQEGNGGFSDKVAVVDASDPLAVVLANDTRSMVVYLHGTLSQDQIDFLQHSSGTVDSAFAIGNVPADVAKQVGELIAGPVGFTTASNPVLS